MSQELLDFVEDHAESDEFFPLVKDLFTYRIIVAKPVIAVELWITGQEGFTGTGYSKSNPHHDKFNYMRGLSMAVRRAAQDFMSVWGTQQVEHVKQMVKDIEAEERRLRELVDGLGGETDEMPTEVPPTHIDWEMFDRYMKDTYATAVDQDKIDVEVASLRRIYLRANEDEIEIDVSRNLAANWGIAPSIVPDLIEDEEPKSKRSKLDVGTNFIIK